MGARAKGLGRRRLRYRYAGRKALLPVVTVIGLQFDLAMTAVVFVEPFSYPGVGGYLGQAINRRDYPVAQGAFLLLTLMVLTANLFIDLLCRRLDPRTKV